MSLALYEEPLRLACSSSSSRCAWQHPSCGRSFSCWLLRAGRSSPLSFLSVHSGNTSTFVTRRGKSLRTRGSRPYSSTHKSTSRETRKLRQRSMKSLQIANKVKNQPGSPEAVNRRPLESAPAGQILPDFRQDLLPEEVQFLGPGRRAAGDGDHPVALGDGGRLGGDRTRPLRRARRSAPPPSSVAGSARPRASLDCLRQRPRGSSAPHAALSAGAAAAAPSLTSIRRAPADGHLGGLGRGDQGLSRPVEKRDQQLAGAPDRARSSRRRAASEARARPASSRAARSANSRASRARRCWP